MSTQNFYAIRQIKTGKLLPEYCESLTNSNRSTDLSKILEDTVPLLFTSDFTAEYFMMKFLLQNSSYRMAHFEVVKVELQLTVISQ